MNTAVELFAGLTAAVAVAGGVGCWTSIPPRSRAWGPVIFKGPADGKGIALTFDDGPTAGATDALLATLARLNVPAAFFAIGRNVKRDPSVLRAVHDGGHVVGNHSFDHSHFGYFRGPWYWDRQIRQTDEQIERAIGRRPAMFRPPLGVKTPPIHAAARRAGQAIVTWTLRGLDGVDTTPQRIADRFGPAVTAGDILLLHDGIEPHHQRDPTATLACIEPLVDDLRGRGFRFERLDTLLKLPAYAE